VHDAPGTLLFISETTTDLTADLASAHQISFKDLTAAKLHAIAPDTVICPLVSAEFDAILLLERLNELGFQGQCVVISAKLPQYALVLGELQRAAGQILVTLNDTASI
jgi:hypothetical protein